LTRSGAEWWQIVDTEQELTLSMSDGSASPARSPFLGELLFPDFQPFAFQAQRLLSECHWGGGDATEAVRAIARIRPGDFESWYAEWHALAEHAREGAVHQMGAGHTATAIERFLSAANYYRSAEFFLPHTDPRAMPTWRAISDAFARASELMGARFKSFSIPYVDGGTLPGYIVRPVIDREPRGTVIFLNGADGMMEESWVCAGRAFVERGLNFITIDGPGQGGPLREQGIVSRPDYEVAVSPVLDYARGLDFVDSDRIALCGMSMGGYYAGRVASNEPRLACVAIHGALFNMMSDSWPRYPGKRPRMRWITGSADDDELQVRLAEFDLTNEAPKITMPIYISHGEEDTLVDPKAARALYEAVGSVDKTLRMWSSDGLGGATHCSVDNPVEPLQETADWLADHLA